MSDTRQLLANTWCILAWSLEKIPRPRRPRLTPEFWILTLGVVLSVSLGLLIAWANA